MKIFKHLFLLVLILFCYLHCFCQPLKYVAQQYTTNNGLPQNSVQDIVLDKNNFVWLATQDGICRFDGKSFETFDMSNVAALKSNRFFNFSVDQKENVLVNDDYFNLYEIIKTSDFVKERVTPVINTGAAIYPLFNLQTNSFCKQLLSKLKKQRLLLNKVINLHELYLGFNNKIYYFNNLLNIAKELKIPGGLPDLKSSLIIDKGLCIISNNKGHFVFKNGEKQPPIKFSTGAAAFMQDVLNKKAYTITDDAGTFGIKNEALYQYTVANNNVDIKLIIDNFSAGTSTINKIKYDSVSKRIFVGSSTNGLFILRQAPISTMLLKEAKNSYFNSIVDIVPFVDGDLMTYSQHFNIYTGETHLFDTTRKTILNLFRTSDGKIFYERDGLLMSKDNLAHVSIVYNKYIKAVSFLETANHRLIIGIDAGLWEYKNDKLLPLTTAAKNILLIFPFSNSMLWLLTTDGIFEYNSNTGKIDANPIFPFNQIRSIYRAKDGSIWLGTYGLGFYKYYNGTFTALPLDTKSILKYTHNFYEDENGFFWMPTNGGLVQCLKSDLDAYISDHTKQPYYYYYDQNDGLLTKEFNGGGKSPYVKDSLGTLIYPTIKGIAFFNPLLMKPDLGASSIVLGTVVVDGKQANKKALELPPNFNQLVINFSYPYYGNQNNIFLEYRVEGLDTSHWMPLNENRQLIFNRLPNGNYKLDIRKKNGFGINNYKYASISFSVKPHFYNTLWFLALSFFLTVIIVFAIFFAYSRALIRRKNEMERLVKARTVDLNNSLEQLNRTVDELYVSEKKLSDSNELKEKTIAIILHDIKAPMNYLNIAASSFKNNINSLNRLEIEEYSESFAQAAGQTNKFVAELLQWLLVQKDGFKPARDKFNLFSLLVEVEELYKDVASWKRNTILIDVQHDLTIVTDHNMFKLIVRNLVDNAIKSTQDGTIKISGIKVANTDKVQITVIDNGSGIDKEELERINAADISDIKISKTTKLGFELIKSFLQLLAGTFTIESTLGEGTKAVIVLINATSI